MMDEDPVTWNDDKLFQKIEEKKQELEELCGYRLYADALTEDTSALYYQDDESETGEIIFVTDSATELYSTMCGVYELCKDTRNRIIDFLYENNKNRIVKK